MANDGETTTTLPNLFKQRYRDFMHMDAPRASGLSQLINRKCKKIDAGGTALNVKWPVMLGDGVGSGALTEGGDYPAAQPSVSSQYTLALTHAAFTVEWTGHTEAMGTSGESSFTPGLTMQRRKLKELTAAVKWWMACQLLHDGTPLWGQVSAASGNVLTITGCPVSFFKKGMKVTLRALTTGSSESLSGAATAGIITDVDVYNGTITLTDGTGADVNDYVALSGHYDTTVPNGLENLVDDAGTVQGVNRATAGNSFAKAVEHSYAAALDSPAVDLIRDRVMDLMEFRESNYTSTWVCNRETRRWITEAQRGQNRFNDMNLSIGKDSATVNDKDGQKSVIEDSRIRAARLFAITPEKWVEASPEGMRGGYAREVAGSVIFPKTGSAAGTWADATQSFWIVRYNTGIDDFRCQGKLTTFVAP